MSCISSVICAGVVSSWKEMMGEVGGKADKGFRRGDRWVDSYSVVNGHWQMTNQHVLIIVPANNNYSHNTYTNTPSLAIIR